MVAAISMPPPVKSPLKKFADKKPIDSANNTTPLPSVRRGRSCCWTFALGQLTHDRRVERLALLERLREQLVGRLAWSAHGARSGPG